MMLTLILSLLLVHLIEAAHVDFEEGGLLLTHQDVVDGFVGGHVTAVDVEAVLALDHGEN